MSNTSEEHKLRELMDLNEFRFYYHMPNSEVVQNDLGYFVKNKAIETYSYVTPTHNGDVEFEDFMKFAFSYFKNGEEYFVVKIFNNDSFRKNSKILRQYNLFQYPVDTSLMSWSKEIDHKLVPDAELELNLLTLKDAKRWVTVFFDAFSYPPHLKKYISSMVDEQMQNGIEFYVGRKYGKDISCFCAFEHENFIGFYGVGTRKRFIRQGYATKVMSNYMLEAIEKSPNIKFCLQAQNNSGAEQLYLNLGFKIPFVQKRFDWDPSTCNLNL
ncbi:MAG: GNAT family N-acetyltransferase [Candidatus Heimdallarchaeaceae archaeon]